MARGDGLMDCVFCDYGNKLLENDLAYAIYDKHPVSEGHVLVTPKRHVSSFFETSHEERKALLEMLEQAREYIISEFSPHGFNVGINEGKAAGQTIAHLHIHLIPRYEGDVEEPRGGIRGAIPEKRIY
jgi:diadenosine tetraphosphate (Ap4A) HIT family hydrolase